MTHLKKELDGLTEGKWLIISIVIIHVICLHIMVIEATLFSQYSILIRVVSGVLLGAYDATLLIEGIKHKSIWESNLLKSLTKWYMAGVIVYGAVRIIWQLCYPLIAPV